MKKRTILITGASSGIGKALAYELAKRGYALGLTARRLEVLQEIQADLRQKLASQAPHIEVRALDITQDERILPVFQELSEALGGLGKVIVNAGIGLENRVGKGQFANARRTIETNLIGAMATVDAAVTLMKAQGGGHIIGISSVAGFRGLPGNAAYSASKAGFSTYLEGVRVEVRRSQIQVTVLNPGYIDTPLNDMIKNRPFVIPVEKGAVMMANLMEREVLSSTVPVLPWSLIGVAMKLIPEWAWQRMA